jgi:hypothetical protein
MAAASRVSVYLALLFFNCRLTQRGAQALRQGAATALWQCALSDRDPAVATSTPVLPPPPPAPAERAAGARDRLACAVATALGDLLVYRGDDAVAAAAMLVARDERLADWAGAMAQASRPLRVMSAAGYLAFRCASSSCSCLGVSMHCTVPAAAALCSRLRVPGQ